MKRRPFVAMVSLVALLAGCGGGSGGGSTSASSGSGTGTGGGTSTTNGCSLRERQDWAAAQLREWYLFPETLPASLDPSTFTTVGDYIDGLTATARGQRRDRFFTYLTSIAQENAFYASGESAGFGIRLSYDTAAGRVFVNEAFEGTSALAAGIDRGTEILAIGTDASNLRTVSAIIAAEGVAGVTSALGPTTAGTARVLRVTDAAGGARTLNVTKTVYELTPVSARYGAKIVNDGGKQVGYLNMRTFIETSDSALRNAFASFRAAGVTEVVIDLRYNGGGLVSIADLFGNLLGRNRSTSDVFSFTTFRPEKSSSNSTRRFSPQSQSIAPTKIAFIGTGGTASASELVINGMRPYLVNNQALVGTNTFGKPVGQIALDKAACDDRLRVLAFSTQNANNAGFYYDGLAPVVEQSCQAADDVNFPLGDPREASFARALDFLAGRGCTRISEAERTTASARNASTATSRELITPDRPTTPQREVPGSF
ncbi:MAG: S41 family peptidase [Pseudomonadota bacterium]